MYMYIFQIFSYFLHFQKIKSRIDHICTYNPLSTASTKRIPSEMMHYKEIYYKFDNTASYSVCRVFRVSTTPNSRVAFSFLFGAI